MKDEKKKQAASEEVKKYAANSFDSVADCIDCLRSFPD